MKHIIYSTYIQYLVLYDPLQTLSIIKAELIYFTSVWYFPCTGYYLSLNRYLMDILIEVTNA